MPSLQARSLSIYLFTGWAAAILLLALAPFPPTLDVEVLSWDKFQHAAAFGLLALLGGAVFVPRLHRQVTGWLLALAAAVLYGGLIEISQAVFTVARRAEWTDLLADVVGAAVVSLLGLTSSLFRRSP